MPVIPNKKFWRFWEMGRKHLVRHTFFSRISSKFENIYSGILIYQWAYYDGIWSRDFQQPVLQNQFGFCGKWVKTILWKEVIKNICSVLLERDCSELEKLEGEVSFPRESFSFPRSNFSFSRSDSCLTERSEVRQSRSRKRKIWSRKWKAFSRKRRAWEVFQLRALDLPAARIHFFCLWSFMTPPISHLWITPYLWIPPTFFLLFTFIRAL